MELKSYILLKTRVTIFLGVHVQLKFSLVEMKLETSLYSGILAFSIYPSYFVLESSLA